MTDRIDINRLLVEMRSLKAQTQAFRGARELAEGDVKVNSPKPGIEVQHPNKTPSFGQLLERAVDKVNEVQQVSSNTTNSYVKGEPGVDITEVMVASQKAGVAFQSMLQVRNKIIEAYRDVMNMPL